MGNGLIKLTYENLLSLGPGKFIMGFFPDIDRETILKVNRHDDSEIEFIGKEEYDKRYVLVRIDLKKEEEIEIRDGSLVVERYELYGDPSSLEFCRCRQAYDGDLLEI